MSKEETLALVGKNIKTALVDSEMTQADLAQLVGVSPQTVNAWCNGNADMSFEKAQRVAKALGWPLDELAGHTN